MNLSKPFVVLTDTAYNRLQTLLLTSCKKSSEKVIASQGILLIDELLKIKDKGGVLYVYTPIVYKNPILRVLSFLRLLKRYRRSSIILDI